MPPRGGRVRAEFRKYPACGWLLQGSTLVKVLRGPRSLAGAPRCSDLPSPHWRGSNREI
jgi:hypothetical protein